MPSAAGAADRRAADIGQHRGEFGPGAMPSAGAADRRAADIGQLGRPGLSAQESAAGSPPPQPIENGKPRLWAERAVTLAACFCVTLLMLPVGVKRYLLWYTIAHSFALLFTVVSVACVFLGNTHTKILRFLTGKKVFIQVVVLSLADWLRMTLMYDSPADPIGGISLLVFRIAFVCQDALKGLSRWFRLFMAFLFFFANIWFMGQAVFTDETLIIYVIPATNSTVTTSSLKMGVGTTLVTVTLSMLVTVWNDEHFQYSALYRSYLPKLAVETAGVKPGSDEMQTIVEDRAAAVAAWKGRPRKGELLILLGVVVFSSSIVISGTPLGAAGEGGKESMTMIWLRAAAVIFLVCGNCAFFYGNISWRRLKYTFTSTQGLLWILYTLIFAVSGLANLQEHRSPIVHTATVICSTFFFFIWLAFESVLRISRIMHITITLYTALTTAGAIYMSAYVWQDNTVLVDLNGADRYGSLDRYAVQRVVLVNLLLLMSGSVVSSVTKNFPEDNYFSLVFGVVRRQQILEVESLRAVPDGAYDTALRHRLSRHSILGSHSNAGDDGAHGI